MKISAPSSSRTSSHDSLRNQEASWPTLRLAVSRGFYPLALLLTLLYIGLEARGQFGAVGAAYPVYLGMTITCMLVLESVIPMRADWSMRWRSLLGRDMPMMAINGLAIWGATVVLKTLANRAWLPQVVGIAGLPWWTQAALAVLLSDLAWYWLHRHSHEGQGALGRWLWQVHALHHRPEQVYVFMHVVGHPLNGVLVRTLLMLPGLVLGMSVEAVFAASVLTGFQGLVSHFNVDIRAGLLNRLLVGTELHRFHHNATPDEGKNYGAVVSLWDQLFGTWVYRPGQAPATLGLEDASKYPDESDWLGWMAWPLKPPPTKPLSTS